MLEPMSLLRNLVEIEAKLSTMLLAVTEILRNVSVSSSILITCAVLLGLKPVSQNDELLRKASP